MENTRVYLPVKSQQRNGFAGVAAELTEQFLPEFLASIVGRHVLRWNQEDQPFQSVNIVEFSLEKTPRTHGYIYQGVATK